MVDLLLPTTGADVSLIGVVLLGLLIGVLTGFFGVGGGFLLTPMLNVLFGIPYNIAVGSGLSQMLGTSVAGSIRHARLGNLDKKLALLVMVGTIVGVEGGARLLELMERLGEIQIGGVRMPVLLLGMSLIYIALLALVGFGMLRESLKHMRDKARGTLSERPIGGFALTLQSLRLPPGIELEDAGMGSISVWVPLALGVLTGFLSGLLGVGGGFILMPTFIYILGCQTKVAVGTSLCAIIATTAIGTVSHAMKGNVDLFLVMAMLIGGTIGAQIGAALTKKVVAERLRLLFALITLFAMVTVIGKLLWKLFAG